MTTFEAIKFEKRKALPLKSCLHVVGCRLANTGRYCNVSSSVANDGRDNDCDGLIDEEISNGIDDDSDGLIGKSLAHLYKMSESKLPNM